MAAPMAATIFTPEEIKEYEERIQRRKRDVLHQQAKEKHQKHEKVRETVKTVVQFLDTRQFTELPHDTDPSVIVSLKQFGLYVKEINKTVEIRQGDSYEIFDYYQVSFLDG